MGEVDGDGRFLFNIDGSKRFTEVIINYLQV